jgi:8-oxo-dGTP pyrophosphatase MutT (NUDIX family)
MRGGTTGDSWARCSRGHRHWGRHGAAGLLLRATGADGGGWVLLQHRAFWSHHGGTWGVPGGALLSAGETAERAALRELGEEVAVDLGGLAVTGSHLDDHGGWSYTTVLGELAEPRPAVPAADETVDVRWVPVADVTALPLHPGFAVTWPLLRDRLA